MSPPAAQEETPPVQCDGDRPSRDGARPLTPRRRVGACTEPLIAPALASCFQRGLLQELQYVAIDQTLTYFSTYCVAAEAVESGISNEVFSMAIPCTS